VAAPTPSIVAVFVVRGRVQGVGFRWFVREQARTLGLAGSVRNEPDGSVAVLASGPSALVDRLELALRHGPPGARVESVRRTRPADADAGPAMPTSYPFSIDREPR
jgi:acylphosphatase